MNLKENNHDLQDVVRMARLGLPLEQIALLLDQSEAEVSKNYQHAVAKAKAGTKLHALNVLHDLALGGKCPAATIFW